MHDARPHRHEVVRLRALGGGLGEQAGIVLLAAGRPSAWLSRSRCCRRRRHRSRGFSLSRRSASGVVVRKSPRPQASSGLPSPVTRPTSRSTASRVAADKDGAGFPQRSRHRG